MMLESLVCIISNPVLFTSLSLCSRYASGTGQSWSEDLNIFTQNILQIVIEHDIVLEGWIFS